METTAEWEFITEKIQNGSYVKGTEWYIGLSRCYGISGNDCSEIGTEWRCQKGQKITWIRPLHWYSDNSQKYAKMFYNTETSGIAKWKFDDVEGNKGKAFICEYPVHSGECKNNNPTTTSPVIHVKTATGIFMIIFIYTKPSSNQNFI